MSFSLLSLAIPNISFIEGELALKGTIKEQQGEGRGSEELATPGSKDSDNPGIVPDVLYPFYNEALAVFAMLETPKVYYYNMEHSEGEYTDELEHLFRLERNSIKYYFNPAAEVNVDRTRIMAALVIKSNNCYLTTIRNLNRLNPSSNGSFITDFYPLEALPQLSAEVIGLYRAAI